MAGRGKYVEGTDGSDHDHREKVATFYKFWQNTKLAGIAIVVNGLFIVLEQFAGMNDFATLHPAFLIGPVSYGLATKALAKSNGGLMQAFAAVSVLQALYVGYVFGTEIQSFAGGDSRDSTMLGVSLFFQLMYLAALLMGAMHAKNLTAVWADGKARRKRAD